MGSPSRVPVPCASTIADTRRVDAEGVIDIAHQARCDTPLGAVMPLVAPS